MSDYAWRGVEVDGLERLRIDPGAAVIHVTSIVDSARGRVAYELGCQPDWTFRTGRIEASDGRVVSISSDGVGGWTVDDEVRSDLIDAIDLDLAFSPFTPSLAIRRLDLGLDEEADLVMASIGLDFEVVADEQRCTRLDGETYRFESLDSGFVREVSVDENGIVVDVAGDFERIAL